MDVMRQSIMCRADLSPMTFFWTMNSRVPETDFAANHECANWDKVEEWLEERRVDIYAPGVLNHPVYGKLRISF
jgi:adenine deaminase